MTFEQAKNLYATQQANMDAAYANQATTRERLCAELGLIPVIGGLTPDAVKFHDDYTDAREFTRKTERETKNFARIYNRVFKKELRAERLTRRVALNA